MSSSRRKPVLFLPSLRAKLNASINAYKNKKKSTSLGSSSSASNSMRKFRRSSIHRMSNSSNSYNRLHNPSDVEDDIEEETPWDLPRHGDEHEQLKSTDEKRTLNGRNKKQKFMRRLRKRRRFHVLSFRKLKWFSPLWLLRKLARIYGSFFYIDANSHAPMLMMGMHLSVPPLPLPPIS